MTEFERELIALLDLIDVTKDATLAVQRHDICEKYGYEVVLGEKISSNFHLQ